MENTTPSHNKQRRRVLIACAILSPILYTFFNSWYWLIETLREDNYGYGKTFHFVTISACLLFNALIVYYFYKPSSNAEKMRLWLKASAIAFFVVLGLSLLIMGILFLAFAFGGKIGG